MPIDSVFFFTLTHRLEKYRMYVFGINCAETCVTPGWSGYYLDINECHLKLIDEQDVSRGQMLDKLKCSSCVALIQSKDKVTSFCFFLSSCFGVWQLLFREWKVCKKQAKKGVSFDLFACHENPVFVIWEKPISIVICEQTKLRGNIFSY